MQKFFFEKSPEGEQKEAEEKKVKSLEELLQAELNILFVDDNEPNHKMIPRIIGQAFNQPASVKQFKGVDAAGNMVVLDKATVEASKNLRITVVERGQHALNLIKNGHVFDLILLDDKMPEKTGTETSKELREYELATGIKPNKILTFSDSYEKDTGKRCYDQAQGMVDKPMRKVLLQNPDGDFYKHVEEIMIMKLKPITQSSRDEVETDEPDVGDGLGEKFMDMKVR